MKNSNGVQQEILGTGSEVKGEEVGPGRSEAPPRLSPAKGSGSGEFPAILAQEQAK